MAHTHSKLLYHCVFGTKHRRRLLDDQLRPRLYDYLAGILRNHGGLMHAAGGMDDHVHILIELRTDMPISEAMRTIKAVSSKWIHETFPDMRDFGWQTGYGAFTVSVSGVEDVINYIQNQEEHHRTRSFDEEYVAFLRRHAVAYDERFVFD